MSCARGGGLSFTQPTAEHQGRGRDDGNARASPNAPRIAAFRSPVRQPASVAAALVADREQRPARHVAAHVVQEALQRLKLELLGAVGAVRRQEGVGQGPQRRVGRQRLDGEDVEGGAADAALRQRCC